MKKVKEINKNEVRIDGSLYRKVEEPKPKFKVGDWAVWDNSFDKCLFYITKIDGIRIFGDEFKGAGEEYQCFLDELVSATSEVIETHLKKICDERYPIGTKYVSVTTGNPEIIEKKFKCYFYEDGAHITDGCGGAVYSGGKFAEIIPDKKKLPKTINEYIDFLVKYDKTDILPIEFLKQYE